MKGQYWLNRAGETDALCVCVFRHLGIITSTAKQVKDVLKCVCVSKGITRTAEWVKKVLNCVFVCLPILHNVFSVS